MKTYLRTFLAARNSIPLRIRAFSTTVHSATATKLPVQPYFSLSHMIREIRDKYERMSNDELRVVAERPAERVRTGGRIVGRRKASKDLLFLDLQSNGETI